MATTSKSNRRSIDQKLHRIVEASNSQKYPTAMALGRFLKDEKTSEFSYERGGRTEFSASPTIARYAIYARDIALLDGSFECTRTKTDVRSLTNFQQWLGDSVLNYLAENKASVTEIEKAIVTLFTSTPASLPTLANIRLATGTPLSLGDLRLSLRAVALLKPTALSVTSRRLIVTTTVVRF
jgi:hypothetical protein